MSRIIFTSEGMIIFRYVLKALPKTFKAHLIESSHSEKKIISFIFGMKLPSVKKMYSVLEIFDYIPGFHNFLFEIKNVHFTTPEHYKVCSLYRLPCRLSRAQDKRKYVVEALVRLLLQLLHR